MLINSISRVAQRIFSVFCLIVLLHATILSAAKTTVLCTTFPIWQITRNVTFNCPETALELMLPATLGCPHEYALTPADMRKLAGADILVINGLGLEEFLGAPLAKANPKVKIIDSSAGIPDLINYPGNKKQRHSQINPHLFVSPRMAALLAENIAEGLAKLIPSAGDLYQQNSAAYAKRLRALGAEFSALGKIIPNKNIVQPHGAFDYLARDMGLKIIATLLSHGQAPSAAEMLQMIDIVQKEGAALIVVEPQYPSKAAETFARETGLPCATLDPTASGPENAPRDYYEKIMRKNLTILRAKLLDASKTKPHAD